MKTKKRIIILGATGSVGQTVLNEISNYPEQFDVVGISCSKNVSLAEKFSRKFSVEAISIASSNIYIDCDKKLFYGKDGLAEMISSIDFDTLVVATSGIDALKPTLRAIELGKNIILANKEILVTAGDMIMSLAAKKNVKILPLDSEHNAIFQCLQNNNEFLHKIQLTASGGKFWNSSLSEISDAQVETVLRHPKWSMGKKITVDSSTMANKGLEIIEAMHLFNIEAEKIDVLIHPDCVVHSLVAFSDGNFLAQMSPASMSYAARFCLFYPNRCKVDQSNEKFLDLSEIANLQFFEPDFEKFPCLKLAYLAAKQKQSMHIAYNASNEIAVELFLSKKIPFASISAIIESSLEKMENKNYQTLEEILAVDQMIRAKTIQLASKFYV